MFRLPAFLTWLLLIPQFLSTGQSTHTVEDWVNAYVTMRATFDGERLFFDSIWHADRPQLDPLLKELTSKFGNTSSILLLKAKYALATQNKLEGKGWREWSHESQAEATREDDKKSLFSLFSFLGNLYFDFNYDTSIFYLIKAVEAAKEAGYEQEDIVKPMILASHLLYRTQNYRECISYCLQAVKYLSTLDPPGAIAALNNLGLSYQHVGQYDSAVYYHQQAADYARDRHNFIWQSISSGNIGDALYKAGKEEEALPYWKMDYDSSMKYGEPLNAMMSRAFIDRYEFYHGLREQALRDLRKNYWSSHGRSSANVLAMSKILGDFYLELNIPDSARYYFGINRRMEDSINILTGRNNYNLVQMRMAYEKEEKRTALLQKEKSAEILKRNILLISLLTLALLALLYYNRQRLKSNLEQKEKALARAEADAANNQLSLFTQLLLEKNTQIESLNDSLHVQKETSEDELIHTTLLTDYDWNRFRDLFEKIHPGFFNRLKMAAPGITTAEMRLASLMRLKMDNKQMASMQGVSVGGIRVTKTRLRQKFNIPHDKELEELIRDL